MQRYEEYSDSRYSYNPYRDYSDGRMRSDMRKRPQLKSAVYRRCRNLVTGEKSTFRKTAMSVYGKGRRRGETDNSTERKRG